jgi:hypothetical protein
LRRCERAALETKWKLVQSKAFTVSRSGDMSWASLGPGLEQGRFMKAVNDRRGS